MNFFHKFLKKHNNKGFTLIEVIVAVAIVAILAAITVPLAGNYIRSARIQQANTQAGIVANVLNNYLAEEDLKEKGMRYNNKYTYMAIGINGDGAWEIAIRARELGLDGTASDLLTNNTWRVDVRYGPEVDMKKYLKESLGDIRNTYIVAFLKNNSVEQVLYLENFKGSTNFNYNEASVFAGKFYEFAAGAGSTGDDLIRKSAVTIKDGVASLNEYKNYIIGTSPEIND